MCVYVYIIERCNKQEDAADIENELLGCMYICLCTNVFVNIHIWVYMFARVYMCECMYTLLRLYRAGGCC